MEARTIKIYPACPRCGLTSGVERGKYKLPWYCWRCKRGFNEPKEGVK